MTIPCELYHKGTDTFVPGQMEPDVASGIFGTFKVVVAREIAEQFGLITWDCPEHIDTIRIAAMPGHIYLPDPPETITVHWYERHPDAKINDPLELCADDIRKEKIVPISEFQFFPEGLRHLPELRQLWHDGVAMPIMPNIDVYDDLEKSRVYLAEIQAKVIS